MVFYGDGTYLSSDDHTPSSIPYGKREGVQVIIQKDDEHRWNTISNCDYYMWDYRDGKIFNCSFESLYTEQKLSEFRKDSLAFLPLMVDLGNGKKVVIIEADLEDYPGMFLDINKQTRQGLIGARIRF